MEKKYIIRAADEIERAENHADRTIGIYAKGGEQMSVSDGYHTMDELYEHRITLYITLARMINQSYVMQRGDVAKEAPAVWRSKHYEGWFILGINKEEGRQITYHLPIARWSETDFAETLDTAPEWDKHRSEDVLNRLKNL